MKYTTVEISGIITSIAKETDVKGYTVGVIEAFMLDGSEIEGWSVKQVNDWTRSNNRRMRAICKFLNEKEY